MSLFTAIAARWFVSQTEEPLCLTSSQSPSQPAELRPSRHMARADSSLARSFRFLGTFILCFVVWETAVSPAASCGKNACIAIGFAVFLAHVLLLPIDGCSINPTRSFGPALVSAIRNCPGRVTKGLEERWAWKSWRSDVGGESCWGRTDFGRVGVVGVRHFVGPFQNVKRDGLTEESAQVSGRLR